MLVWVDRGVCRLALLVACRSFALIAVLFLAACAGRPGPEVLTPVSTTVPGARVITIYVATTRERAAPDQNVFTNGRSPVLNYAELKISVPPNHRSGNIEWPRNGADPNTSFVTVSQRVLDESSFRKLVETRRGVQKPNVNVFVHGFNTNFQEALFRLVQITADSNTDATMVLFAWPSVASVTGYLADRDAVTFSRDSLAYVLTMLARSPEIGGIRVTAHSMGAWLTAESIRQLRLTKQDAVLHRIQVILAAPDIDVSVFRSQLAVIGPLSPPMIVLVSTDDVALSVSSFLSGSQSRVGALDVNNPLVQEAAQKANVQVIDISSVSASDSFRHGRFAELAVMIPQIKDEQANGELPDLQRAGTFVFNAVSAPVAGVLSQTH